MNEYKLRILKREFPFLEGVAKDRIPDAVAIKRGDENLLKQTPFEDSYSWSRGGHYYAGLYFAVTGETVDDLEASRHYKTASQHEPDEECSAPTIGEQLFVKELAPDFIVHISIDNDDDNNRHSYNVTIYKMSKFNLAEYHCRQIDRAADELKAEIASICEGGAQ